MSLAIYVPVILSRVLIQISSDFPVCLYSLCVLYIYTVFLWTRADRGMAVNDRLQQQNLKYKKKILFFSEHCPSFPIKVCHSIFALKIDVTALISSFVWNKPIICMYCILYVYNSYICLFLKHSQCIKWTHTIFSPWYILLMSF